ncbi:MAG: hypothetical protein DI547_04280 [Sphingobium sp.]|jgi:hypothetical protein|nr:MAG: hypothetical protein DI547_04280 [Sphingobium sp.]
MRPDEMEKSEAATRKGEAKAKKRAGGTRKAAAANGGGGNVGTMLQSVYRQTVEEDIPAEMLDLLSKLD